MKPLFDLNDIYTTKHIKTFPFECEHCSKTFYVEKKLVRYGFKKPGARAIKFCSKRCSFDSRSLAQSQTKPCANCSAIVKRNNCEIKKTISDNIFCNSSCAATYNNLHKTKGTRRSKLEVWVESKLKELYPKLNIQYNTKNHNTELDIYIPTLKLAIELNGIFHYKPIYGDDKFAQIQKNDMLKKQSCVNNNIELLIIDVSGQKRFTDKSSIIYFNMIKSKIDEKLHKSS